MKTNGKPKRVAATLLTLIMTVTLMTALALPAAATTSGTCGANLTWTLDDSGTLTIAGSGAMSGYQYPSHAPWYGFKNLITTVIIGNGVTTIGTSAFEECDGIMSVTIPDSVKEIKMFAFENCDSLMNVSLGNSVTTIDFWAFYGCRNLTSIVIPDSVTTIEACAFYNCSKLSKVMMGSGIMQIREYAFASCTSLIDLTIGKNVNTIGKEAFEGCDSLMSVIIPDSVTTIEDGAFSFCDSLTFVKIGSGVTTMGSDVFFMCPNLTTITVDSGNQHYASDEQGVLYNKSKTILVQYPRGKTNKTYRIPNGVITIGTSAFSKCSNLTIITIPDSVKTIGKSSLAACSKIKNIAIGKGVKSIVAGAFNDCESLTNVYYGGTQEDWETILIAADNVPLTSATIYFNTKPKNMRYEVTERKINIFSDESFLNIKMVMAVYRAKELIDFKTSSVDIAEGENRIPNPLTDFDNADTVKIMLWSDRGVTPLMEMLEIKP